MSAREKLVLSSVQDNVGHLILNRPLNGNAINLEFSQDLSAAISELAKSDIGSVIISANGSQFCVGGDISGMIENRHRLQDFLREMLNILHPAMLQLATLPVPVISVVNGPVGGGGMAIALCADFVLASELFKMRAGYTGIGLSPDMGSSFFISQRAGSVRAKQILMTNHGVSSGDAKEFGLIDEIHPADEITAAAEKLATSLANGSTPSASAVKLLCNKTFGDDLKTHLDLERQSILTLSGSADAAEGIAAFIEKRQPLFRD
jgi:2-(1,2-epoxy-1,2-dihydrophenyl)acetyl-CoA isomerase